MVLGSPTISEKIYPPYWFDGRGTKTLKNLINVYSTKEVQYNGKSAKHFEYMMVKTAKNDKWMVKSLQESGEDFA